MISKYNRVDNNSVKTKMKASLIKHWPLDMLKSFIIGFVIVRQLIHYIHKK